MDGILYINKEKNMTSFDVVARLRKILNTKTIGHTGTLDPNAEGLLIILVGKYTKLLPYCMHDNKGYIADFKLGILTDTLDIWGKVIKNKETKFLQKENVEKVLKSFIGKQQQIPPMYSAKKVKGQKLYELARNNIEIERNPIDIEIFALQLLSFGEEIKIDAVVSNGTYIRSLINDIGIKLDNYACMTSLTRYKINNVRIESSLKLDQINASTILLKDPKDILDSKIEILEDNRISQIKNGVKLTINSQKNLVLLKNREQLLAVYEKVENNLYKCKRGLW